MFWLVSILLIPSGLCQIEIETSGSHIAPCEGREIKASFETPIPGPINQYTLIIRGDFQDESELVMKFDSNTYRVDRKYPDIEHLSISKLFRPKNSFRVSFFEPSPLLIFQVYGPPDTDSIPYIRSITYDGQELCKKPRSGYFDFHLNISTDEAELDSSVEAIDESCGRRKVVHTELIVHGQPTKPGDWPWHVAILRIEKSSLMYICGGTLLSKTLVLTAAHCASLSTNPVVPDSLSVELGKYNLFSRDIESQTRETSTLLITVFEVILHPRFDVTLNNDIALLKLKSEAVFTDYVQPACLWHTESKLPTGDLIGTVAGWGFNHQEQLSTTLQQVTIPIVSELDCLKSNPSFFHQKLNTNKFCAGFANGTSACNGDSGGGLMIFVPDRPGNSGKELGAWYVRGIVSLAPSRPNTNVCDPDEYTIITDVVKYRSWLSEYLN